MPEELVDALLSVPLKRIRVNPHQPRKHFAEGELSELAASIREVGIIHPPTVRPVPDSPYFELIAGERRFRASQLAGLETIPVFVRESDQQLSAEAALVENIQRVDLNPMEVSRAIKSLIDTYGYTQDQLARKIGKKRSTVANYLRLLSLDPLIQGSIAGGQVSMGHAKVILSLPKGSQLRLHERIIQEKWTVREAEDHARKVLGAPPRPRPKQMQDVHLYDIQQRLQQDLGTQVCLRGTPKRGRLELYYHSLDDLDRLLNLLGYEA
jgi:ParB family chromosome partitioning protein